MTAASSGDKGGEDRSRQRGPHRDREREQLGYTRIKGALKNLGHEIGRNTLKRSLQENGIDPASALNDWFRWERDTCDWP